MNSLELQEKTIYTHLQPYFSVQGYEVIKPGKEFRKTTPSGFKSVLCSLSRRGEEQILDIQLGIRFNLIESLVAQFLTGEGCTDDPHTIIASPHHFRRPPIQRFFLKGEESLQEACKQIGNFMEQKGFRFLNSFDKLKQADRAINRRPEAFNPYIPNQIHRCFRGIVLAKLLQRTDFETLCLHYRNYLFRQQAIESIINFDKLVNYLRYFSFN